MALALWSKKEAKQPETAAHGALKTGSPPPGTRAGVEIPERQGPQGEGLVFDFASLKQEISHMELSPDAKELVQLLVMRLIDDALTNIAVRSGVLEKA